MAQRRKRDHQKIKENLDREINKKELLIRKLNLLQKASNVGEAQEKYERLKNKLDSRRSKYFF